MRLVGENAIAQAAGIAMSRPSSVEPDGEDDRVDGEVQIVGPLLDDAVVLHRPVEEQELRRRREGLELGLEAGEDHPQDREEDEEADDPGGHRACRSLRWSRRRRGPWSHASRFLPTMRTRKKATMLARITATMPPAEAPPTSKSSSACGVDQEGEVGGRLPGPPSVVTQISAKTPSRKIVSIRMTTVIGAGEVRQHDVEEERERRRRPSPPLPSAPGRATAAR